MRKFYVWNIAKEKKSVPEAISTNYNKTINIRPILHLHFEGGCYVD